MKKSRDLILFFCLVTALMFNSCVSTTVNTPQEYDTQVLVDRWLTTNDRRARKEIINTLKDHQDIDGLIGCLKNARYLHDKTRNSTVKAPLIRAHDVLPIIEAIAVFKDPQTIVALQKLKVFSNKEIQMALLGTYEKINTPEALKMAAAFLKSPYRDVRMKALEIMAGIKTMEASEAIIPVLFDDDPLIRWKAVHALGDIYNPRAVDRISLLLADDDGSVRDAAETVLEKLKVPREQINRWKEKAKGMSFDDVYRTRLAYEKAISENTALQKKVKTLQEVKLGLEDTLKGQANALEVKEKNLNALTEKKHQLEGKNKLLNLSFLQSQGYQKQLEILNEKYEKLNRLIKNKKQETKKDNLKDELEKTTREKISLEKEIALSKNQETVLQKEIQELELISEQVRNQALDAQKQVEEMTAREALLLEELEALKKDSQKGMKPVVLISGPQDNTKVNVPYTFLHVFAVDDKGIEDVMVKLNGMPVKLDLTRQIKAVGSKKRKDSRKLQFRQRLKLAEGENTIRVVVTDISGISTEETIRITRTIDRGQIYAAIIGINDYQNIRDLNYAVNDARAFKNYLKVNVGIPEEKLFCLTDRLAAKENIQRLLGTNLKRLVSEDDTVFIYFAGHGAVESDPANPDGDGFEKYLLPYGADLKDLYTSAISMDEIKKIFQRIRAERLIFIADSCYSGASGGRTILANSSRASLSDNFLDRISKGKGRVIISSCSANEVSQEDDNLRHGLFTYYFLKGLRGKADYDGDGLISVAEVFGYVSRTVPEASGQDQHPVKKGEIQGELIIGKAKEND